MYSTADYAVTPRPMYRADGRKLPDIYTTPAALRDELQSALGHVPAVRFLGTADVDRVDASGLPTRRSASKRSTTPTLTLVYLPHLDYNLQRLGPRDPAVAADICARSTTRLRHLIEYFESRGAQVIVLSEYGLVRRVDAGPPESRPARARPARRARGARPRAARRRRQRRVRRRRPPGRARLRERRDRCPTRSAALLEKTPGVERVLDRTARQSSASTHPRARRSRWRSPNRTPGSPTTTGSTTARAGLRADRRYPPQAGLRPGRAVARPGDHACRR